jgi:hypothetical protein
MQVDVLTDVANAVAEQGAFGQAENNNSARIEFGSELARYPDLLISNVVVEPARAGRPASSVSAALAREQRGQRTGPGSVERRHPGAQPGERLRLVYNASADAAIPGGRGAGGSEPISNAA